MRDQLQESSELVETLRLVNTASYECRWQLATDQEEFRTVQPFSQCSTGVVKNTTYFRRIREGEQRLLRNTFRTKSHTTYYRFGGLSSANNARCRNQRNATLAVFAAGCACSTHYAASEIDIINDIRQGSRNRNENCGKPRCFVLK